MDTESLPDEKARLVGNIKGNVIAAWICMAATALFACLGASSFNQNLFAEESNNESNWVPFITLCLASILTIVGSAVAWHLVARDRKLLGQLRAIAVQEDTLQQPGVWPPPPREQSDHALKRTAKQRRR